MMRSVRERSGTRTRSKTSNTTTTRPYTGPELENRFDDWAKRRKEQFLDRGHEANASLLRRCLAVLLGLLLIASAVANGVSGKSFKEESAANSGTIETLRTNQEASPKTAKISSESIGQLSDAANQAGKDVAEGQNTFANLFKAAGGKSSSDNGAPGEADKKIVDHRRSLAKNWDPASFVVSDDQAYSFHTTSDFEQETIDPRYAWFIKKDGDTAAAPDTYSWAVQTVMPKADTADQATVSWLCRDKNGAVLAWASATYSNASKKFSDLSLTASTTGEQQRYAGGY
jgi:hypothetical protein